MSFHDMGSEPEKYQRDRAEDWARRFKKKYYPITVHGAGLKIPRHQQEKYMAGVQDSSIIFMPPIHFGEIRFNRDT